MNRAWHRRRTKRGLAARQMDAISRAMRRDKRTTLPRTYTSKGIGLTVTVTLGAKEELEEIEDWSEVDDFLDAPYDTELSMDQARWIPDVNDPVEQELARWP